MKTRIISLASTLLAASFITALAQTPEQYPATWIGNSSINVNGTYYASSDFINKNLDVIPSLTLGGKCEATAGINWNDQSTLTMSYRIDENGPENTISLLIYNWNQGQYGNNMCFQSGGSTFQGTTIDLTNYNDGNTHTLYVWFNDRNVRYDNNDGSNYSATFKVGKTAKWIGNSAINVNGTWYYAGDNLGWNPTPDNFDGKDLGAISALYLGGQSQIWDNSFNWEGGEMNMSYKIDNGGEGLEGTISLSYYNFSNNNMYFQSGGADFEDTYIDVSELGEGTHTLAVWFERDEKYDNNYDNNTNTAKNYVASFTVKSAKEISNATTLAAAITEANGNPIDVKISGLTLYKDTYWNTMCLPFSLSTVAIETSPLAGAVIHELTSSSFSDGELTLNFAKVNAITAGKPYIVKWEEIDSNIEDPVFVNVSLSSTTTPVQGTGVSFKGTFDEIGFTSVSDNILFLGDNNTLYNPDNGAKILPFRAYFEMSSGQPVKAINLNFGDDTNSIQTISNETSSNEGYFTLDGRRLNDKPATAGLYIINGKKVVIK